MEGISASPGKPQADRHAMNQDLDSMGEPDRKEEDSVILLDADNESLRAQIVDLTRTVETSRLAAVLEERNRMAQEIHDTLAQAFTGILLQLRVAQRIALTQPKEAWAIVDYATELTKEGLAEARRSVWALQPEALEYSDLAGSLERAVKRISAEASVHVELQIHGTVRQVEPSAGKDLLHIAQEALINALRHGKAEIVQIHLTFEADSVALTVQDDGAGFDVGHQADGGGFGLIGMSQRTERLGGKLTVVSAPGRGTEVAVTLPTSRSAHLEENP